MAMTTTKQQQWAQGILEKILWTTPKPNFKNSKNKNHNTNNNNKTTTDTTIKQHN